MPAATLAALIIYPSAACKNKLLILDRGGRSGRADGADGADRAGRSGRAGQAGLAGRAVKQDSKNGMIWTSEQNEWKR
jgi:hypothetical protein